VAVIHIPEMFKAKALPQLPDEHAAPAAQAVTFVDETRL